MAIDGPDYIHPLHQGGSHFQDEEEQEHSAADTSSHGGRSWKHLREGDFRNGSFQGGLLLKERYLTNEEGQLSQKEELSFLTKHFTSFRGILGHYARKQLELLSLEEQVGMLCLAAVDVRDETLLSLAKRRLIGGCVVATSELYSGLQMVETLQSFSPIPLLVVQEFDREMTHWFGGFVRLPSQETLQRVEDETLIFEAGIELGKHCRQLGIHANFLPIQLSGIVKTGGGDDKQKSLPLVKGLQESGVIACAKYPVAGSGTGSTAGSYSVAVAHLSIHSLDAPYLSPKALAPVVVEQHLNEVFGFKGLVFSDLRTLHGIELAGIECNRTEQERIVPQLFRSEGDLFVLHSAHVLPFIAGVKRAVEEGVISREEVQSKVLKMLLAKEWLSLHEEGGNVTEERVLAFEGLQLQRYQEIRKNMYRGAVKFVRAPRDGTSFKGEAHGKVALIRVDGPVGAPFEQTLKSHKKLDSFFFASATAPHSASFEQFLDKVRGYDEVVLALYEMSQEGLHQGGVSFSTFDLIERLSLYARVVVVVLFGQPEESISVSERVFVVQACEQDPDAQIAAAELLV